MQFCKYLLDYFRRTPTEHLKKAREISLKLRKTICEFSVKFTTKNPSWKTRNFAFSCCSLLGWSLSNSLPQRWETLAYKVVMHCISKRVAC